MIHELQVAAEAQGQRLDQWLEHSLAARSRVSQITAAIKAGLCQISPGKAKPAYRLQGGEHIVIELPEVELSEAEPEDLPLSILYEDEWLVVIDKAAGMVVHPAVGHVRGTLVNALLGRYGQRLAGEAWRPGIIHRLDAATSGVIAVAKNEDALVFYQQAFRERRVQKHYVAVVAGSPRADFFAHDGAIGRHPKDFRKRAVVAAEHASAKAAHTSFLVRQRQEYFSVVECRPTSGRTHQIRVHLADLGHPCLADGVYGRSANWPLQVATATEQVLTRHALHAWQLQLPQPDGSTLCVRAPIPDDLAYFIDGELALQE